MNHEMNHQTFALKNNLTINIPASEFKNNEYFSLHREFYCNSKGQSANQTSRLDFETFPFHQFYQQTEPTWFKLYETIISHNYFSPRDSQEWIFDFYQINIAISINDITSLICNGFWCRFDGSLK